MEEASFKLEVNPRRLGLEFNYAPVVIVYSSDERGVYFQYFDGEKRFSFHGDKLMDMRNFRVVKGEEAVKEFREVMEMRAREFSQGVEEVERFFGVDLRVIKEVYESVARDVRVDPRAFLDIKIKELTIDAGREFRKDMPGLVSARRLISTLDVGDEGTKLKVVIREDGSREYYVDGVNDFAAFSRVAYSASPSTLRYSALIKSLLRNF